MLNHMKKLATQVCHVVMTEAESAAGVMVVQDMLYVYRLLESMDLSVELPMLLEMDNKGAVNLKQLAHGRADSSRGRQKSF